jgi:rhodanese-related sulfurtransferase
MGYRGDMSISHRLVAGLAGISLLLASCGGDEPAADAAVDAAVGTDPAPAGDVADEAPALSGISTISVEAAAAMLADPPADLVVLDVRTPEEFAEGHLDGAVLIDFYDADFAEQLAALDRTVPYLVYCRSDNRSGQAMSVMADLGFTSAVDVDGGIVDWVAAGLPVSVG